MDGIRDTSFSGQAEQRIPYFTTVNGFNKSVDEAFELSVLCHRFFPLEGSRSTILLTRVVC